MVSCVEKVREIELRSLKACNLERETEEWPREVLRLQFDLLAKFGLAEKGYGPYFAEAERRIAMESVPPAEAVVN